MNVKIINVDFANLITTVKGITPKKDSHNDSITIVIPHWDKKWDTDKTDVVRAAVTILRWKNAESFVSIVDSIGKFIF